MTQKFLEKVFQPTTDFTDQRGVIVNFLKLAEEDKGFKLKEVPAEVPNDTFVEVAYITFNNKGDVRANHYHPDGLNQFVYCVAGSYETYAVKLKKNAKGEVEKDGELQQQLVKAGDIVYTPSMVAHAMKTLEPNTVILNLNPRKRDTEGYHAKKEAHTLPFKII
ncbi:MAG: dTDP-4-dehydrorhamnose 3,5-epimerase family protein [Nanoarchaeota archaeon]|nr:dTDP-4-dehydrorhamnose 3,5-epimerase family protein [Nanoarchaeota archaeon]